MILITGVSKGIGQALATYYIATGETVIGIGRSHSFSAENFHFISCDLEDPEAVKRVSFPDMSQEQQILFIHNAGILGEVNYFDHTSENNLQRVLQVNLFSGASLIQQLLKQNLPAKTTCIIIGSGAGINPIPGWAAYCSSKAAVNMFCETLQAELIEQDRSHIRVYSVAPGVVDTTMQSSIRLTPETRFKAVGRFIDYKENRELYTPEEVVRKLVRLLDTAPEETVQSLRNY